MATYPDEGLRLKADHALQSCHIGPAVSALIEIVMRKDIVKRVRTASVEALGSTGPDAEAAVPALVQLLSDQDEQVPGKAKAALDRIGSGPPKPSSY
jgi:HEAT repeat protein